MSLMTIGGLASGIDTGELIKQLMGLERRPVTRLQDRQQELRARMNAWRDVNLRLFNLQNRAADLRLQSLYGQYKAVSSDSSIVAAATTSAAAAGSYQVEVMALARAHSVAGYSAASMSGSPEAGAQTMLGLSGTLTINGQAVDMAATDSLEDLRSAINGTHNVGVTASVVDHRLVLTRKETGATEITLGENDLSRALGLHVETEPESGVYRLNTIQAAADARVKINNLEVVRSSNVITGALEGITLTLRKESESPVTLNVERDLDRVVNAVESFVQQYNSTYLFLKESISLNERTGAKGTLFGEGSLHQLLTGMRRAVTGMVWGSHDGYTSLSTIGIITARYGGGSEGTLILDQGKLREVLAESAVPVMRLFGAARVNVAAGALLSASSQLNESYPADSVVNGDTAMTRWGSGNGWINALNNSFDDPELDAFLDSGVWIRLDLRDDEGNPVSRSIDQIELYTTDSVTFPADQYGIRDYDLQYWDGNGWQNLLQVRGNTAGVRSHSFEPVTTEAIRVKVYASNDSETSPDDVARILEIKVKARSDGAANRLADQMLPLTRSSTGLIASRQQGATREIERLDRQIAEVERRLSLREASLHRQFLAMEKALGQMMSRGQWMENQLRNLSSWKLSDYRSR